MLNINTVNSSLTYPLSGDALLIPSGYTQNPEAFEITAVDILNFAKDHSFNLDIFATPDTFRTIELNSNLHRLGKFVVKDVVLPVFVALLATFIQENYLSVPRIDSEPVKVSVCINVCDSLHNEINKKIDFEGTADDFNQMAENIKELISDND